MVQHGPALRIPILELRARHSTILAILEQRPSIFAIRRVVYRPPSSSHLNVTPLRFMRVPKRLVVLVLPGDEGIRTV